MTAFTAYKYLSAASARRCIEDGTLYLAGAEQLNDTLEARFSMASADDYLATVEATLAQVARQRDEPPLSLSPAALAELIDINQRENERFRAFCEQVGICSLAQRPNHQAMWAYYGEGGEGLCVELTFTAPIMAAHQLLVGPVAYSDQARVFNRAEDWRTTFLELAEQYPGATIQNLKKMSLEEPFRRRMGLRMAQRATSLKRSDWEHEDEIRLLGPSGRTPLPILDQVLVRVHFLSIKALSHVAPLLAKHYPHVGLVQWTFDHGELQARGQPMDFKLVPLDGKGPATSPADLARSSTN